MIDTWVDNSKTKELLLLHKKLNWQPFKLFDDSLNGSSLNTSEMCLSFCLVSLSTFLNLKVFFYKLGGLITDNIVFNCVKT